MNVLQLQHELLQFIEPETFQSVDQVCRPLCHNNCLNLNAQKNGFEKWAIAGLLLIYFRLFEQTLQFLKQINVKNVHPIYSARI